MDIKLTKLLFALMLTSSFFLKQEKDGTATLKENEILQILSTDKGVVKKNKVPFTLGSVAYFPKY